MGAQLVGLGAGHQGETSRRLRRFTLAAIGLIALGLIVNAAAAAPAAADARPATLKGPNGTSRDKVLVIGVDGTRWDVLQSAIRAGRAPNLARLARKGFARSSRLDYPPNTLTISEVGWSSIASGVWPGKHGVDGSMLNQDPGQATKNGFLDFITRLERRRPRLSTFTATDWDNLALKVNGGPIFGTAMDTKFAPRVREETLEAWDRGDEQVAQTASKYLRRGNPDAGFVYFGVVDESAHTNGSATPAYPAALARTDKRIGTLLDAIRARKSYARERWTILVTTDHGERPLTEPSPAAHFGDTPLERTVFVLGSGPGLRRVKKARVVDVLPTVLGQLGIRAKPAWNLDGRALGGVRRPASG